MALPSSVELQARTESANQKLADLQVAHDNFLAELEKIQYSETELLKQAREFLEKSKVYKVLHHINTLN